MEARELVRDEGRRGGRASAARTASAKLLAAPVAVAAIRTPADLMINMRRVIYRLARSELSPPSANALLRGLEHERDRILRHVDPDIVEGGGGFFRDLRRRRDQDGDSARRVETESMSSSLDLDELNRPVRGDELTMIQRGLEHDAVHGRPPPEDWRGCVRRYLVEERSDVAYEDETMRRVVGLYRYRVVEGRRPQDVKVQRVFVPIRRVEGGGAHRAATT